MKKLLLSLLLMLSLSGQAHWGRPDEYVCNTAQFVLNSGVAGSRDVAVRIYLYYLDNSLGIVGIVLNDRSFYFRVDERLVQTSPSVVPYRASDTKAGIPVALTLYYTPGRALRTLVVGSEGNTAYFYVKYVKSQIL